MFSYLRSVSDRYRPILNIRYLYRKWKKVDRRIPIIYTCIFFLFLSDNMEGLQEVVKERLAELIRVLKTVISKHQTLNSVDILGAAGMVIAKVKGE